MTTVSRSIACVVLWQPRDICGDLEVYSDTPINPEAPDIKNIFQSYHFDPGYVPQFNDVFLYAQILYRNGMYKAAAPIFELSLTKLNDDKSQETMRRVATDQAGMSYGISGDISKARSLFESAIARDPDYPMYYYNLACADAEEKSSRMPGFICSRLLRARRI